MKTPNLSTILPYVVVSLLLAACGTQNQGLYLQNLQKSPERLSISNEIGHNYQGGHIQGVQVFHEAAEDFLFLSASANDQSYYAIASLQQKKVLSINTFLDDPFRHAGGFQIAGNLLAVGIEDNRKKDRSKVMIYQIIDPRKPELRLLKTIERAGEYKRYTAGCVAITEQAGTVWVAVGNWDTKDIDYYSIPKTQLNDPTVDFKLAGSISTDAFNRDDWIEKSWFSYQNINFFHTKEGQLYLIGTTQDRVRSLEIMDVFSMNIDGGRPQIIRKVAHRTFRAQTGTTLRWGGGIYQDDQGKIKVYATGENIGNTLLIRCYEEK